MLNMRQLGLSPCFLHFLLLSLMIAGAIALSLVMLLLVLFYYQQPKTLEEQEADDRLVALQKGITLEQLIEKKSKEKSAKNPKRAAT